MTIQTRPRLGIDTTQAPPGFVVLTEELQVGRGLNPDQAAQLIRDLFEGGLCIWLEWHYDRQPVIARYATEEEVPFAS